MIEPMMTPQKQFTTGAYGRYRRRFRSIDGWIDRLTADILYTLSFDQTAMGCRGGIVEIGVHHGKSFLPLYLGLDQGQVALAIDVFEDQLLNLDGSGRGDRDRFLENVRQVSGSLEGVELLTASSLDIKPADIVRRVQSPRIFSIDGGHTSAITKNDLLLANDVIAEDGVVILDDLYNPMWPGVLSGFLEASRMAEFQLVPFAIIPGKVLFARSNATAGYKCWLTKVFGGWCDFEKGAFGVEVLGVGVNGYSGTRAFKTSPLGFALKSVLRVFRG